MKQLSHVSADPVVERGGRGLLQGGGDRQLLQQLHLLGEPVQTWWREKREVREKVHEEKGVLTVGVAPGYGVCLP